MTAPTLASPHRHDFLGPDHGRNESRTWAVIGLTTAMMVAEITAGSVFGSMALLADGWHMATHAAALLITALAYRFARRRADDARFTFGTGKVGDLAGFASAVVLAVVALLILWESVLRLATPVAIGFNEALAIAVIGLVVNLVCAWLLGGHGHAHLGQSHGHGHHHHGHDHHHDHDDNLLAGLGQPMPQATTPPTDNNLQSAYAHVLADALTSVLAILALLLGAAFGWTSLDPLIGILGALVILRWSVGLLRDSGAVLLDCLPADRDLPDAIRAAVETTDDKVTDLHVWQLGPGHHGVIVSLRSERPLPPSAYRRRLAHLTGISHLTIEVDPQT
jgi:cation diffusion facilitator family transporter